MDFPVQFAQSEESYVSTMQESDQRFEVEFTEEESWDIQFEEEDEGFQLGFEESTDSFSVGFEEGIFTGGVFTAKAGGAMPATDMTIQATLMEVI